MSRRIAPLFLLLSLAMPTWGADNASDWLQIRSPHFTVVTDSGEHDGRRFLDQMERMRWVFQNMFPWADVDPSSPIVAIALRTHKDMQALEPTAYLAKGQLDLAGLFLRAPDTNYILVRMDVEGAHPYTFVYHEYTHLELGTVAMPIWLNEGLAEFFQNTEIRDKDVILGEPDPLNLRILQQQGLIPLPVLLHVDAGSPYYHEEDKGNIFYAESWALTHLLEIADFNGHTNRIGQYLSLVSHRVDPVDAAQQAFGDLKKLQSELADYTRRLSFGQLNLSTGRGGHQRKRGHRHAADVAVCRRHPR